MQYSLINKKAEEADVLWHIVLQYQVVKLGKFLKCFVLRKNGFLVELGSEGIHTAAAATSFNLFSRRPRMKTMAAPF